MSPMSPRLLRPQPSRGFNPRSISGLYAWFDAEDTSTTTTSAGISSWRDKSGTGLNAAQSTGNIQPLVSTINGKRAISFFQGSGLIAQATYSITAQSTFCVFRCDTATGFGRIVTQETDAANATYIQLLIANPAAFTVGSFLSSGFRSGLAIAQSAPTIGESHHSGSAVQVFINGTGGASFSGGLSFSPTRLCLGNGGALVNTFLGLIGEVLVWNRALTSTEITTVRRYLSRKWGITTA
jgi:hypothetical protein